LTELREDQGLPVSELNGRPSRGRLPQERQALRDAAGVDVGGAQLGRDAGEVHRQGPALEHRYRGLQERDRLLERPADDVETPHADIRPDPLRRAQSRRRLGLTNGLIAPDGRLGELAQLREAENPPGMDVDTLAGCGKSRIEH
jgi:hypothetical protein